MLNSKDFRTSLFLKNAYIRDMLIQNFPEFWGTLFQNLFYLLAYFNLFKIFLWLHLLRTHTLICLRTIFFSFFKVSTSIYNTVVIYHALFQNNAYFKMSQFWDVLIFEACLFSKQCLLSRIYGTFFQIFSVGISWALFLKIGFFLKK